MQYSKSFANFAPSEQQRQASTQTRAQRRSSLDTFIIPGRTRLPSSKASTFDLQVTQGLLNSNLYRPPRKDMTSTESFERSPDIPSTGCMPRRGAVTGPSGPLHHRVRPDIVKRPPPRFGGREVIIVPSQRPRLHVRQPSPQDPVPVSSQEHASGHTYDGAHDSTTESRLTSMSWSTVSHRMFSGSSGSSRTMGASYYRDEFNKLAEKHNLPRLETAQDGTLRNSITMGSRLIADIQGSLDHENHSQTKTTTKTHHPGWLARKLFRRSSSTYTLKAKTTYKPISKKKSFGGIPVLSEDSHKNILKGKSLEELGRLGGLSILVLPPDFAVDKLTLPTCLSATATYLYQHGCNAPGIFRVSGQTTIVNALYDFYDHQFANVDAGSPSKVEQTVGSGLLPSHIEHTVPDVASFFKRVLIDLPGGLLGSVELFEALRIITTNFEHDPELSETELARLRAKMIALAISSVASDYRLYLIQAVLGLVSYLGHEAEKDQAEIASADEDQIPSELMNYRSLGVVLGPLLLGNLTDHAVHGNAEGHGGPPRTSLEMDSAKKFRKHKRKHSDMKLDQSATLAAFVDRANRTATVMQQLLLMWPDVVKQLRDINSTANSSLKSGSKRHLKNMPSHTGSRLTLKTSEEEMRFLDILRGRTLPEEFRGTVKMKSNIRLTSRSPMSKVAIDPSEDDNPHDTWLPTASKEFGCPTPGDTKVAESAAQDNEPAVDIKLRSAERTDTPPADDTRLDIENRPLSDVAMEKMAMGTILPPLQVKPSSSSRKGFLRLVDSGIETPQTRQNSSSSSKTPGTALKDAPPAEHSHASDKSQLQISMRKPLPPIGDAQRAELSFSSSEDDILDQRSRPYARDERPESPRHNTSSSKSPRNTFSSRKGRQSAERTIFPSRQSGQWPSSPTKQTEEKATFPPRQSSLPFERHLALKPIETYTSLAEYKAKAGTYMSPPKFDLSRKASEVPTEQDAALDNGPRPNNVKLLANKFADVSRALRRSNDQAKKETAIPRIYAYVNSLPSPKSPMLGLDDPFSSAESNNISKESLIPKPVRDVGRSRESRSLSPPKRAAPTIHDPKRQSAFGIVTDQDAEIVQNNTISNPPTTPKSGEEKTYGVIIANSNGVGFSKQPLTQLLDVYHHQRSAESLRRLRIGLEESPPESRRIHNRSISFAELARPISYSRPDSPSLNVYANPRISPSRTNSYLDASDALKPLERHASINATMYREICRLQRLLQQMGEEKEARDRRIEALEEVQGGNPVATGVKAQGSFGKGGLHNEVRKAKRELSLWKMRAELAERRLSGLKQLSDSSWESQRAFLEHQEPTERLEVVKKWEGEKEMGGVLDGQRDSPESWKKRAALAESQLARIGKQEREDKGIDIQEVQGDSPDLWKRRAIIAESQLAQIACLGGKRSHSEMARTTPSPLTAKVYVAVETDTGEKEEGTWDLREEKCRRLCTGDYSRSNSEKEVVRRAGPRKKDFGSDDESSDFVTPLNGFG